MNGDLILKLQAWVDGELPGDEARQVEALVAANKEAAALANELRTTCGYLRGNETAAPVPDSPEFYWSKIRRGIERLEAAEPVEAARPSVWSAFRRFMVPASGLALVMIVGALSIKYSGPASIESQIDQMVEVENLSEDMSSMSYRSQSDNMFVVFLYSKDQGKAEEETPFDPLDDLLFQ